MKITTCVGVKNRYSNLLNSTSLFIQHANQLLEQREKSREQTRLAPRLMLTKRKESLSGRFLCCLVFSQRTENNNKKAKGVTSEKTLHRVK